MSASDPQEENAPAPMNSRFMWTGGSLSSKRGSQAPRIAITPEATQDQASAAMGRLPADMRDMVQDAAFIDAKDLFVSEIRARNNADEVYGVRVLSAGESVKYGTFIRNSTFDGAELPGVAVVPVKTFADVAEAIGAASEVCTAEKNYLALLGGMEHKKANGLTCIPSAAILRVVAVPKAPALAAEDAARQAGGTPGTSSLRPQAGFTPGAPGAASVNAKEVGDR